jgi:putative NIF3 family GTP cyclohydrolase 1 type 2
LLARDLNLPHKLRNLQHDIVTASYMGWGELRNGELLQAAESEGFDVFVTGDQSLADEQILGPSTTSMFR